MESVININKDKDNIETDEFKIYEDYKSFQGSSFENNINSINNLLFGQGLKISEIPFIIKDENNKKILALNQIKIKSFSGNKIICYPKKCVYTVFYYEKFLSIFYLVDNKSLEIYKLNSNNITQYIVPNDKVKNPEIKENTLNCDDMENLFKELENIKEKNNILDNYRNLCNILKYKLKRKLDKSKSKKSTESLTFKFTLNGFDFSVDINNIEEEVDGVGLFRDKLYIKKGKTTLSEGIKSIVQYVKLKSAKNPLAKKYINNSFKCPILYKNFDDEIIPENQTLFIEIKSGFDILGVEKQIDSRIEILNYCIFKEGEKPTFFIGLINLDSTKIDLLSNYMNLVLNFEKNTLIISCVDSEYCGIDSSYELNTNYLLNKGLNDLNEKMDNMNSKFDIKFDALIETLQKVSPGNTY